MACLINGHRTGRFFAPNRPAGTRRCTLPSPDGNPPPPVANSLFLGRTLSPLRLVSLGPREVLPLQAPLEHQPSPRRETLCPRQACPGRWKLQPPEALLEHRPPPGQDCASPRVGVPGPLGTGTPCKPFLSVDHRLDKTPRTPNWRAPTVGKCCPPHPLLEHRPAPRQDSPIPLVGVHGPKGAATPCTPSLSTDHRMGRTPCSLRVVCPSRSEPLPPAGPP